MAKTKKTSKDIFKKLKRLTTDQRVREANNAEYGRVMLSLLTPTQYAELFPKWYWSSLPDIGGFRAALTKKSQKELEDRINAIEGRVGSSIPEGGSKGLTNTVRAKEIYDYIRSKGIDHAHAVGMVNNIQHESGFNSANDTGDNGTSFGLFQHHLDRADRMRSFASQNGQNWRTNWKGQIDFALSEPETKKYLSTSYGSGAAASVGFTTIFERPANAESESIRRLDTIKSVEKLAETPALDSTQTPTTVAPQQIVGEVPPQAPPRPVIVSPENQPEPKGSVTTLEDYQKKERKERKRKDTATVNSPVRQTRNEEVSPDTPAYAGGGRRTVKGPIEVRPLHKKHKGDTAVVTDRKGRQFTVNPQEENISVNPKTNVMDIKPDRHTEQMDVEKLMAIVRRQESGKFEGNYEAKSKTSTASGAYQFLKGTWKSLTKKYGVGTEYKTAGEAPREIQEAVAKPYFEDLRKKGYDDETILKVHFTGNPQGRMTKKAMAANKGLTADQYVKSIIQTHGPEYDKIAKRGGLDVAASKTSAPKLETQLDFAPSDVANQASVSEPASTATTEPSPVSKPKLDASVRQPEQTSYTDTAMNVGEKVKQMAGLSVRASAQQSTPSTPGSINLSKQPAPVIGPSPSAAERVGIPQAPNVITQRRVDTGTITPSKTTQMDLLREEMKTGFDTMRQPLPTDRFEQVKPSKPIITEMPPDIQHQNMMSTLPATTKDPYNGVPSLERAANRAKFDKERPWALGNKH